MAAISRPMSLAELRRSLAAQGDLRKAIEESVLDFYRDVALDVYVGAKSLWPRATGASREEIRISIGRPDVSLRVIPKRALARRIGSPKRVSAGEIAAAKARLSTLRLKDRIHVHGGSSKMFAVIEYGLYPNPPKGGEGRVAGGFSKQAPRGAFRISVASTVNKYKSGHRAFKLRRVRAA